MNTVRIITHSGTFHADDVMAVATVLLMLEKSNDPSWRDAQREIIRTRDPEIINTGTIVVDVGGIYDDATYRFDHHQQETAGQRDNGIPYASFGLVWKKWGATLCESQEAADLVERKVVTPIDAVDNGVQLYKSAFENIEPYTLSRVLMSFVPTWQESTLDYDAAFAKAVAVAQEILTREIAFARSVVVAREKVEARYAQSEDKQLIILDEYFPWQEVLVSHPEPLVVVYPSEDRWHARMIPDAIGSFGLRKKFPESWAGKRDKELADVSGVRDAVFCHNKLFLAVAQSKEGALALAKKALE